MHEHGSPRGWEPISFLLLLTGRRERENLGLYGLDRLACRHREVEILVLVADVSELGVGKRIHEEDGGGAN